MSGQKNYLVTGANRGLGLEFTKQILRAGNNVYAACRNFNDIEDLDQLSDEYKNRYGVNIIPGDGSTDELNSSYLPEADIIFCAARAGTQVISMEQLNKARNVKILAIAQKELLKVNQ